MYSLWFKFNSACSFSTPWCYWACLVSCCCRFHIHLPPML